MEEADFWEPTDGFIKDAQHETNRRPREEPTFPTPKKELFDLIP